MKLFNLFFVFAAALIIIGCSKENSNPVENKPITKITGLVKDVLGLPMAGINIKTEPATQNVTTDNSGKFEIPNINAGVYKVIIAKDGYLTEEINANVKHSETTDLQITLRILMNISGVITDDSTGAGIDGAKIIIEKFPGETFTNPDGTYSIQNIPAGTNIFSITKVGYIYKKFSVNVQPNKTSDYNADLQKLFPLDMILVEGGTFQMGDTFGDGSLSEKPAHEVTVSSFYMSKTELTQKEWLDITANNPAKFWENSQPVESISWRNAVEYCNSRSVLEGLNPCYTITFNKITCDFNANGYRLPTEAEWEFAARGGKSSSNVKYSGSTDINEVAWYDKNASNITHPVAQKKANELGLFDMCGNVWEFCWDYYDEGYYAQSTQQNPEGPENGQFRAMRGGAWSDDAFFNRVSYRNYYQEFARGTNVGVRLVRSAQ